MHSLSFIALVIGVVLLWGAQDKRDTLRGVDDVHAAREKYETELSAAVDPVHHRFMDRLQSLERELTRKGDLDGALAARAERDRLVEEASVSSWQEFVGKWVVRYDNGAAHTYEIRADGAVHFLEEKMTLNLRRHEKDVILDFGGGKVERLAPALTTEMFKDDGYPTSAPKNRGQGARLDH